MKGKMFGHKKKETKSVEAKTAQNKSSAAPKPASPEQSKSSPCCG